MLNHSTFNIPQQQWDAAKAEALAVLLAQAQAKVKRPISYSELVSKITRLDLEPHSQQLAHMLGEISEETYKSTGVLLTALVVHKEDNLPGNGFFELAKRLGERFGADQLAKLTYWTCQFEKAIETYGKKT